MEGLEPKKLALIRIWQILKEYSDYDHPLTQEEIAEKLYGEYGIDIERKAIGRNLSLLKEAGVDVDSRRAGSYLASREFEDAELQLLIDGVLSSRHITAKHSQKLIEKICGLSNRHFRARVKHIHSVNDWSKTENQALFFNIEMIDEAIEQGKQIHYDYNKFGVDKKLHKSSQQYVSPYLMILHNQRYYLMAYSEYWGNMVFHRMDRITNMSILADKPATPLKTVSGYENGIDYKALSTSFPYMYTDEPVRVEFLADEGIVDQIVDWFGNEAAFGRVGEGRVRVFVKASPMAMTHWAMQYGPRVQVLSPAPLADAIKRELREALEQY